MTFEMFLIDFMLLIIAGSFFVCGFYVCTRGEWYLMPDGSFKKYGMIFKEWQLFWEQYRKEKKIFYKGESMDKKWDLLRKTKPSIWIKYMIFTFPIPADYKYGGGRIVPQPGYEIEENDLITIKDLLACEIALHGKEKYFELYENEPVYMFPSWVRKPLSECPACMASVYGSAFYWFVILQLPTVFRWSCFPVLAKYGFWVIFCLILACLNKYISQKMKL